MPRSLSQPIAYSTPFRSKFAALQAKLTQVVQTWTERRRHRAKLCGLILMGPDLIAEMGMTIEEAETEAGLPFWQPHKTPRSRLI